MHTGKIKVLIADDEFRIAKLIEKLIHWDEHNMECVGIVDNGETAFEQIRILCPDIVITDVRMPKINGLDLVRMTKEIIPDMRFIVVSGYKEFEYAHKALQYEVDSYLLKPINETELDDVLRRLHDKLLKERKHEHEQMQMEKTVIESQQIIKRDFLKSIIEQNDSVLIDDSRVVLEGSCYRGIDIKLDYTGHMQFDRKQDRITVEKVTDIVKETMEKNVRDILICEKEYMHIFCLLNYDDEQSAMIDKGINQILSELQSYLLEFERYEVTIGVGEEKTVFSEIRDSLREAYRAVGNRIRLGTGRLIYVDTLAAAGKGRESLKQYSENLYAALDSYSIEKTGQCINQIYHMYMDDADVDYAVCYALVDELLELIFYHINIEQEVQQQLKRRIRMLSQHCYTVSSLRHTLKEEIGNYLETCKANLETESVRPIRQAKQYIDEHYAEKILLEDISEIVGLNPVYFSVLFKKETDLNFSSYLANVRMDKAREMLTNSNETIAKIGEQVGYRDSRYFSQIFTKIVGMKPALYRRLHS